MAMPLIPLCYYIYLSLHTLQIKTVVSLLFPHNSISGHAQFLSLLTPRTSLLINLQPLYVTPSLLRATTLAIPVFLSPLLSSNLFLIYALLHWPLLSQSIPPHLFLALLLSPLFLSPLLNSYLFSLRALLLSPLNFRISSTRAYHSTYSNSNYTPHSRHSSDQVH